MTDTVNAVCNCQMRKKVAIGVVAVIPEEICGIPDSELSDFVNFDLGGPGSSPVLQIKFCPWCGKLAPKPERITQVDFEQPEEDDEWRGASEE